MALCGGFSVQDAALDVFRTLLGHTSTREDKGQPIVEGVMRPPTHAWGLVEGVAPGRMDKDEYTKERCFMTQLQIVYLLRSRTQERWRRLCQEVAGRIDTQMLREVAWPRLLRAIVRWISDGSSKPWFDRNKQRSSVPKA